MRALRRPELLQWFGLLGGALAWAVQHVVGFGLTLARCSPGGDAFPFKGAELASMAVAAAFVLLAETAAVGVLLATRGSETTGPPPAGRRRFFAVAALVANVLFLVVILTDGLATNAFPPCRQG